jgi:hypothetical protein
MYTFSLSQYHIVLFQYSRRYDLLQAALKDVSNMDYSSIKVPARPITPDYDVLSDFSVNLSTIFRPFQLDVEG